MFNKQKSSYITLGILAVIVLVFMYNKTIGLILMAIFAGYKSYTSRAAIITLKANKAFSQNKLEESMALFEKAYHTKGCTFKEKNIYGFVNLKYGDINIANKVFTELMSEKLDEASLNIVKNNYAMVLWKQDRLDEAIDILKELYNNYKTTALYGTLGAFLIQKGNLEEAYSIILESYEYDNSDNVILDNLGQIYYLRGENQKALEIFERLLEVKPHFPEAYYDYGKALMKEGKYSKALELSKEALSKEFNNLSTITRNDINEQIKLLEEKIQ